MIIKKCRKRISLSFMWTLCLRS